MMKVLHCQTYFIGFLQASIWNDGGVEGGWNGYSFSYFVRSSKMLKISVENTLTAMF